MLKEYIDSIIFENEDDILIPRRSKQERDDNYQRIIQKQIEKYIQDGMKETLQFTDTPIKIFSSEKLTTIGRSLNLFGTKITKLNAPNLKSVGAYLYLADCMYLTELNIPNLETVGKDFNLHNCDKLKVFNPQKLTTVGGYLSFSWCESLIEFNTPNLKRVGGNLNLRHTPFGEQFNRNSTDCRKYFLDKFGLVVEGDIEL